jgi:hypothetical protein
MGAWYQRSYRDIGIAGAQPTCHIVAHTLFNGGTSNYDGFVFSSPRIAF